MSGELRGNLYQQGVRWLVCGRETRKGFGRTFRSRGVQPHDGLIYFNDIHTGIWVTKMVDPAERAK